MCLLQNISLTTEPIWLTFTVKLLMVKLKTHLIVNISQAEDGFLFDLTQDGEEGGFHTMTVQSVLPSLKLKVKITDNNTF